MGEGKLTSVMAGLERHVTPDYHSSASATPRTKRRLDRQTHHPIAVIEVPVPIHEYPPSLGQTPLFRKSLCPIIFPTFFSVVSEQVVVQAVLFQSIKLGAMD